MAEVIASILADRPEEVLRQARLAAMGGADWIEIRLDGLPEGTDPKKLLGPLRLPVLVACRTPRDGGRYRGSLEARRQLLQKWVDAGVEGLDLEAWETWVPSGIGKLRMVMRSFHNFTGTDDNLVAIRDELLKMGADVAKIAVTAHDLVDAAPVLDLLASTDQEADPTVAFSMGEDAFVSRILACVLGAPFIYASVAVGLDTAPGQIPVEAVTGIYDVRRLTGSTLIYGVLGNPARSSWGPWLFNRAFRMLEHDAIYLPFTTSHPVAAIQMLSSRRLRGLSVTAPHKAAVGRICHEVDEAATMAEALNTLVFRAHGSVAGMNTDVHGVKEAFERAGLSAAGGTAVVLGGGGAARAAALALIDLGLAPVMMPRSLESVRGFAEHNGLRLARMDAAVMAELDPVAVVHATPVGGPADDPAARILPDWEIRPGTFVLDMIYQIRWTRLLRDTQAAGGVPIPGIEMFLAQANEQLAAFTGSRLPRATLADFVGGI